MVVSIHLDDEEKFQVLLVALALFLFASFISLCLALTCCPLNKWLQERAIGKRKQRQQQQRQLANYWSATNQLQRNIQQHHHHFGAHSNFPHYSHQKAAPHNYIGPPPAYEAALRATRLQSLTGTCLTANEPLKGSPDWLKSALSTSQQNASDHFNYDDEKQLDLGDYFHQPRDFSPTSPTDENHCFVPMAASMQAGRRVAHTQTPIMLRLWVKLMEPGELVQRARAQCQANRQKREAGEPSLEGQGGLRRVSLTRQLSIPHLFGSLMTTLNSSNSTATICDFGLKSESKPDSESDSKRTAEQQLSSMSSENSSLTANFSTSNNEDEEEEEEEKKREKHDEQDAKNVNSDKETTRQSKPIQITKSNVAGEYEMKSSAKRMRQTLAEAYRTNTRRRHSILPIASSITSRVLHMNVASFSYVKDEELISTKKHNQMNFHHFYAPIKEGQTSNKTNKTSKMCQLLVSICDIENLLNSSCLNSRACIRLAQNSSIYIKCEILASKSTNITTTASRLLRNPLKVLTHQPSSSGSLQNQHATVDFGATIPATAMEPTPTIQVPLGEVGMKRVKRELEMEQEPATSFAAGTRSGEDEIKYQVNWRHDPTADGKSIVVFNSIPKQIAQQQQLASAQSTTTTSQNNSGQFSFSSNQQLDGIDESPMRSMASQQSIDLIQFDSVFVSPILSKSTLEDGYIRLRVYSQCKYVNETCLAELKLPLKQLMRVQTRDNLGDMLVPTNNNNNNNNNIESNLQQQEDQINLTINQQQQADFILNNLLANLVTASTGSPLSTLIEQISAEAREEDENESVVVTQVSQGPVATGNFNLSNWLGSNTTGSNKCDSQAGTNLQRASNSLGAALNYLDLTTAAAREGNESQLVEVNEENKQSSWQSQCDKLIEQNYCRSLMVSHWLNYLVAPSYECQLVEEQRGQLVLGLTYLPTSNRIIFNAHRATIDYEKCPSSDKQLIKKLRFHSDTSYLLRFMMLANQRVLKRKQTACSRKPEWDSQEPVTFDLVNVNVEQPSFVVALVMRNSHSIAYATGSLQSLTKYYHQDQSSRTSSNNQGQQQQEQQQQQQQQQQRRKQRSSAQSDPESLRYAATNGSCGQSFGSTGRQSRVSSSGKRDLVIGHLVLGEDVWHELRSQPRRQLIKQFKLF